MSDQQRVNVTILDKDYQVACPPNEREALYHAAEELDERMRVIRSSGNVIGVERIAVMTALNLCYELQQSQQDLKQSSTGDKSALQRIASKLERALEKS